MNERITQLAIKAGAAPEGGYVELDNGDSVYSENAYVDPRDMDVEKFAELIIKECIDICRYHPSNMVTNNWHGHDVAQDILQRFEKHLGVK